MLKKKLRAPKEEEMSISDAYKPEDAPEYTLPKDLIEDDDTAATLKSAHLAEWLHHNGGDKDTHHHHDPYYIDGEGNTRHYKRPGLGYEGRGFDHEYAPTESGHYGEFNPQYEPAPGDELHKIWGAEIWNQSGEIRPWWNKLEKSEFDGMTPRKQYGEIATNLIAQNKDVSL